MQKIPEKTKKQIKALYQGKSWQKILSNSTQTEAFLLSCLPKRKQKELLEILKNNSEMFPPKINPYYASLIEKINDGIWKQSFVDPRELINPEYFKINPLNEQSRTFNPTPSLIHRYPTKAMILVSNVCAGHCRHCFRNYSVDNSPYNFLFSLDNIFKAIKYVEVFNKTVDGTRLSFQKFKSENLKKYNVSEEYIERHSENAKKCLEQGNYKIRDVLLSGGDPLSLTNQKIKVILEKISGVKSIETIRIGTRYPALLPQRIDSKLIKVLKAFADKPLYINTQFNHPRELTLEVKKACNLLRHAGLYIRSQTVLLRGVNDDIRTLKQLFEGLINIGVAPYYIYHPMMAMGTEHLRVPLWKGLFLMNDLRGFTSGFAIPTYIASAPGGKGKIPLPEGIVSYSIKNKIANLQNYEGNIYKYKDPLNYPLPNQREIKALRSKKTLKRVIVGL